VFIDVSDWWFEEGYSESVLLKVGEKRDGREIASGRSSIAARWSG
jgi:hypothetical protein